MRAEVTFLLKTLVDPKRTEIVAMQRSLLSNEKALYQPQVELKPRVGGRYPEPPVTAVSMKLGGINSPWCLIDATTALIEALTHAQWHYPLTALEAVVLELPEPRTERSQPLPTAGGRTLTRGGRA